MSLPALRLSPFRFPVAESVQNYVERLGDRGFDIDLSVVPHPRVDQRKERRAYSERRNRRPSPLPKLTGRLPAPNNRGQQMYQIRSASIVFAEHFGARDYFANHHPDHIRMPLRTLGEHLARHPERQGRTAAILANRRG